LGPEDTEPWASLVPKAKLGHTNRLCHCPYIIEVIQLGWVQLSPQVRPRRHGTTCVIGPKGKARTHKLCA